MGERNRPIMTKRHGRYARFGRQADIAGTLMSTGIVGGACLARQQLLRG